MDRTDAELLIASRDDAQAFRELYDRWAERLLAYFYRRVLDAEVAAERVQQLLDDAGWTGWRTTVRSDLGDGPAAR